jgi:hypothetical protein
MTVRRALKIVLGLVIAIVLAIAGVVAMAFWLYHQPPRVELTNHTGGPISQVRIRVGGVEVSAGNLRDGQRVRRTVPFRGSEASTDILWVDRAGVAREESLNDYVEGRGGYRTTVSIDKNDRATEVRPTGEFKGLTTAVTRTFEGVFFQLLP